MTTRDSGGSRPAPDVPWTLAIDFGTSYTTAVVAENGTTELVEVDGTWKLPSLVLLDDNGSLVVGLGAQRRSALSPERVVRSPKRHLGESADLILGGEPVPVTRVVGAVMAAMFSEASRRQGTTRPSEVRLTHPAGWQKRRLGALVESAQIAGMESPILLEEPVAAAVHFAGEKVNPGSYVAVYDLGGGTFDTTVLKRTEDGFRLAGRPGGIDPLGGETFDHLLYKHLGQILAASDPDTWEKLRSSPERAWRKANADLMSEVREAKETLSRDSSTTVYVSPPADRELKITREELEGLIQAELEKSLLEMARTIERSGIKPQQLSGIYLAGGSSRIPLVARLVADRFGRPPEVLDEPKAVVALGAAKAQVLMPLVEPEETHAKTATPAVLGSTVATEPVVQEGADSAMGRHRQETAPEVEKRKGRERRTTAKKWGILDAKTLEIVQHRPLLPLGAAVLVILLLATFFTVRSQNHASAKVVLPEETLDEGLVLGTTWRMAGEEGDRARFETKFFNSTDREIKKTFVLTVPKTVAVHVDDLIFSPKPSKVIDPDPIVRFDLVIPPQASEVLSFTTKKAVQGADEGQLREWAGETKMKAILPPLTLTPVAAAPPPPAAAPPPPPPAPPEVAVPPPKSVTKPAAARKTQAPAPAVGPPPAPPPSPPPGTGTPGTQGPGNPRPSNPNEGQIPSPPPAPASEPPLARDDSYAYTVAVFDGQWGTAGLTVLDNDSGSYNWIEAVVWPVNGDLYWDGSAGVYRYTPRDNGYFTDRFQYVLSNTQTGQRSAATVYITVYCNTDYQCS